MKLSRYVFILFMLIMASFISCDNKISIKSDNYEVSIIEPDYSIDNDEESGEKTITASVDGITYKIKMNPAWSNNDNTPIYGNTLNSFIEIQDLNSVGYFAQGIWNYTIEAICDSVVVYTYNGQVEVNKYNRTIKIDPKNLVVSENIDKPCTIKIADFDVLMVENISKYDKEENGGYKYTVAVTPLENGLTGIDAVDIPIEYVSTSDGIVSSISKEGFTVGNVSKYGVYEMSVFISEYKNGYWEKTGGTSFSFIAIPGTPLTISGSEGTIDLYPSDYVTPGAGSGIEIESGISSNVNVKAYKGVVSEGTLVSSTVSVTTKDTVILVPEVTNGPSSISTYKWFVDGVEQTGTAIDSNGYLTLKLTTAKTYTITYMFLDGTNYNTISGNYYLTVNAAT